MRTLTRIAGTVFAATALTLGAAPMAGAAGTSCHHHHHCASHHRHHMADTKCQRQWVTDESGSDGDVHWNRGHWVTACVSE